MSRALDLLLDTLGRSAEACREAVSGLGADALNRAPAPGANTIAWLVWHAARQSDAQIAALAGTPEVWVADGWHERFGLDLPPDSMGYGHTEAEAARVRVDDPELLLGYLDAAARAAASYVSGLDEAELDDVVDEAWDPPVTRGVRLVSIADDGAQHAGQAAYVRGLLERSAAR